MKVRQTKGVLGQVGGYTPVPGPPEGGSDGPVLETVDELRPRLCVALLGGADDLFKIRGLERRRHHLSRAR